MELNGYKQNPITKEFTHRELYIQNVGPIPIGYEVHHIDKNKLNNEISNLIALPREIHVLIHELDSKGFVLKNKREVQIAITFYLKGLMKPKTNQKEYIKSKKKRKKRFY